MSEWMEGSDEAEASLCQKKFILKNGKKTVLYDDKEYLMYSPGLPCQEILYFIEDMLKHVSLQIYVYISAFSRVQGADKVLA